MQPQNLNSTSPASCEVTGNCQLCRKVVEVALLCVFIIGVWSLLSLPIIFYNLPVSEVSPNTSNITNMTDVSVCSAPLQYATSSGICLIELANTLTFSNCPLDPERNVLVVRNGEATATQLINGLTSLGASPECIRKAVPFLCLYLFGLCGGSGITIQPTTSQCEEVRDTLCQQEWVFVERLDINLPDCAMFPAEASSCAAPNDSFSTNGTVMTNMLNGLYPNRTTQTVLDCTEGFFQERGSLICIPSCYTWTQFSKRLSIFIDVIVFTSAFIGFVSAIAVIIISCLTYKRMLIFPSIFIVYMVIDLLALAFFSMVNYLDRNKLFCSSRSLTKSLREITPFCVISGIVFTYVVSQLALWWLFHIIILFWKVIFPFHARAFELSGKVKYIHITCVTVGILLPLVPIFTSMGDFAVDIRKQTGNSTSQMRKDLFLSGGLGFRSSRFPAILCTGADADVTFYTLVLPINTILVAGCTLLIIIFWSINKVYRARRGKKTDKIKIDDPFKFGTAEKKLLIVFCYYVLLTVISLTAFTVSTRHSSQFVSSLGRYFFCEQRGHNSSNPCSRSEIEEHDYPSLTSLSYIVLALFPVVNLLYAVNVQELKKLCKKLQY